MDPNGKWWSDSDIKALAKEFKVLHKDARPYLSKDTYEALLDSFILRKILLRTPEAVGEIPLPVLHSLYRDLRAVVFPPEA